MPERNQSTDLEFIVLMAVSNALNREPAFRPGAINIMNVARAALEPVQAEMDRLTAVAQASPHTAYLEAVQRACDERMTMQKHRIRDLGAQVADLERELNAARKPEDYWRQVAEGTELSKRRLEQDYELLRMDRDDLVRDIEKQNKDIDEHQARWQRAERELAQWVKNSAVSQRRIEHLERQLEELSATVPNRKDPPG